jgi:hypothetical protein
VITKQKYFHHHGVLFVTTFLQRANWQRFSILMAIDLQSGDKYYIIPEN